MSFVLTKPQRKAIKLMFDRNPDGSPTYRDFRKRVVPMYVGGGAVALPDWCGMYCGIERDGWTHT